MYFVKGDTYGSSRFKGGREPIVEILADGDIEIVEIVKVIATFGKEGGTR